MNMVSDPNRAILLLVAKALGDLREQVVFVGGCAAGLLVTIARAQVIRPTDDVDIVANVLNTQGYYALEEQLRAKGFTQEMAADAPICRWHYQGVAVDVMPTDEKILGFANRWYPLAIETAEPFVLDDETSIRLISAPVFIATKFEAFADRGKGDMLLSHDMEDIITVIDGRPSIIVEMKFVPRILQEYIAEKFRDLLANDTFLSVIPAYLPGDAASQARFPLLEAKLHELARLVD
jgi:predicted nucleotidyltransferase